MTKVRSLLVVLVLLFASLACNFLLPLAARSPAESATPTAGPTPTATQTANQAALQAIEPIHAADRAYHQETRHGAIEGAVFP